MSEIEEYSSPKNNDDFNEDLSSTNQNEMIILEEIKRMKQSVFDLEKRAFQQKQKQNENEIEKKDEKNTNSTVQNQKIDSNNEEQDEDDQKSDEKSNEDDFKEDNELQSILQETTLNDQKFQKEKKEKKENVEQIEMNKNERKTEEKQKEKDDPKEETSLEEDQEETFAAKIRDGFIPHSGDEYEKNVESRGEHSRKHRRSETREDDGPSEIFVGNLSYNATKEHLIEKFKDIDTIVDAHIILDPHNGRSRGFGFVKFEQSKSAAKACKLKSNEVILGRPIRINLASEKRYDHPKRENIRQFSSKEENWSPRRSGNSTHSRNKEPTIRHSSKGLSGFSPSLPNLSQNPLTSPTILPSLFPNSFLNPKQLFPLQSQINPQSHLELIQHALGLKNLNPNVSSLAALMSQSQKRNFNNLNNNQFK
ncbi:hypothetical protein M0811_08267 [Anaeramoeba ignava]|uniref:RRM domain-containing protein n=1 Tax=Anaeramoeba ignava TaxID=1746090 RepID=A0A9Q0RCS0_ANAIG|nr:hypothetical protein M0811_08267 [Anaeramoeba ignava]